jgi:phosphoglucomutase
MTQAICEYRARRASTARSTWAWTRTRLSAPAQRTALEVLAANGVDGVSSGRRLHADARHLARDPDAQPRRAAAWPTASSSRPSHNPPEDGGFKYNPPHGGPPTSTSPKVDPGPRQRAASRAATPA